MAASKTRQVSASATDVAASIIESARILFAESGFDKVSTRDIADRVGIKQATLYYYYPSKRDLYKAVVEEASGVIAGKLAAVFEEPGTPDEKVHRFFLVAISVFFASTPEAQLVDRELANRSEDSISFLSDAITRPHEALTTIIREISPGCPAEHYAYYFFSLAYGARKQRSIQLQLPELGDILDPDPLCRELAEWALKAVRASSDGPPPPAAPDQALVAENARLRELVVDLSLQLAEAKR